MADTTEDIFGHRSLRKIQYTFHLSNHWTNLIQTVHILSLVIYLLCEYSIYQKLLLPIFFSSMFGIWILLNCYQHKQNGWCHECSRNCLPTRSTSSDNTEVSVAKSSAFSAEFCKSLFVHFSFIIWAFYCLSCCDLRILITSFQC